MKFSIKIYVILLFFVFDAKIGYSQPWETTGNLVGTGDYLGSSNNFAVDFRTDDITRMRIMETSPTYFVDGYPIDNSGFVGLTIDPTFHGTTGAGAKPYSLLHLNGQWNAPWGPQEGGYRPWMVPGIVFTHNQDIMYVGPKRNGTDMTDAVVAWGDNSQPGGNGPDVLRFLFLFEGNGTANSSNPMLSTDGDGVECARFSGDSRMGVGPMWENDRMPKRALDVVRRNDELPQFRITHSTSTSSFELGTHTDFQTSEDGIMYIYPRDNNVRKAVAIGSLAGDLSAPIDDTWLDVGGQTRIRDLQDKAPETLIIGYHDENANQSDEDQILGRLDFLGDPCMVLSSDGTWVDICDLDGEDCRWRDTPSNTNVGEEDMYMGDDPTLDCYRQNLIIGNSGGKAKLTVFADTERDNSEDGVYVDMTDNVPGFAPPGGGDILSAVNVDIDGINTNMGLTYIAVNANTHNGRWAVALKGEADAVQGVNIGAYAKVENSVTGNIGMYTEALSGSNNFALQIVGPVLTTTATITLSDESIKTEIENIDNASEILNQLQPKTYLNLEPEERNLSLSEGQQYGFLAQEVQEVLPSIVKDARILADKDSTGFIEGSEMDLLGIQYTQLISILVAGFQEQTGVIGEQQGLIEEQANLLVEQAIQMEALQTQMQDVLAQVQDMQIATNNCCTQKTGSSTGTLRGDENSQEMKLGQNIPNPFTNQTRIDFELPFEAQVILEITDGTGRPIQTLIDGQMSSGVHTTIWDGSGVAPGMYYYTLYANGELLSKKMIKR